MMLKQLKKYLESEKKDKSLFDIVLYGSAVKGKMSPRDIDVLIIFLEGSLRQRLDKLQKIKHKVKNKNIDFKQILLKDLFLSHFLARTGIFLEGFSIFNNKKFSEMLGFKSYSLFWYNLKALSHSQKVSFNYLLSGRGSLKGIIKDLDGERLVNGAIKIPIENSFEFEEVLKKSNVHYKKKDILESV